MPPIFKALASISAWTLFVAGWLALISGYVRLTGLYIGALTPAPGWPSGETAIISGAVFLILAVVAMKLRKSLE